MNPCKRRENDEHIIYTAVILNVTNVKTLQRYRELQKDTLVL